MPLRVRSGDDFALHCQARELPKPEAEFYFATPRRYRFDYAWPSLMLAVEQEGVVYVKGSHTLGGRHVSAKGFREDVQKYALAFTLGWTVLRVLPEHIRSGQAADWVEQRLKAWPIVVVRTTDDAAQLR
jgi:hypothetical protein